MHFIAPVSTCFPHQLQGEKTGFVPASSWPLPGSSGPWYLPSTKPNLHWNFLNFRTCLKAEGQTYTGKSGFLLTLSYQFRMLSSAQIHSDLDTIYKLLSAPGASFIWSYSPLWQNWWTQWKGQGGRLSVLFYFPQKIKKNWTIWKVSSFSFSSLL